MVGFLDDHPSKLGDIWYRYYDTDPPHVASGAAFQINLARFAVVKLTPAGVWVTEDPWRINQRDKICRENGFHWCGSYNERRRAYPTKALAWNSFRIRKRRERAFLMGRLRRSDAVETLIKLTATPPEGEYLFYPDGSEVPLREVPRLAPQMTWDW